MVAIVVAVLDIRLDPVKVKVVEVTRQLVGAWTS